MGFLGLFRKKRSHSADAKRGGAKKASPPRTPEQVVQQALATQDIEAGTQEVREVIDRVRTLIDIKPVLPEALSHSDSAELEYAGSKYIVRLSMLLMGGGGQVSQGLLNTVMSCAVYWASASELAKAKGADALALQDGQKIALLDHSGFGEHPIYALFPDLLNKTVLR